MFVRDSGIMLLDTIIRAGPNFPSSSSSDTTPPNLSSPIGSALSASAAVGRITTDEPAGTLYWVVSESATPPSVAQIQAGNDSTGSGGADAGNQSVSATGQQTVLASGLSASTTYYFYFQHQDASANDSTVSSSSSFTTPASSPGHSEGPRSRHILRGVGVL